MGAVSRPWLQRLLLQICGARRGARAVQVKGGDWSGQLSSCNARPGSILKLVQPQILDTGSQQTDLCRFSESLVTSNAAEAKGN